MKYTDSFIPTLKEVPQDAEVLSHQLMLRAGLIRKLASGTYSYLPLGLKALHKIQNIIRQEMDRAGALEVLLPALHPADLWKESGRYDVLGDDMMKIKDRHGRWNVLGPTHEEIITDFVRNEIQSYRQLPVTFYQIQTKFRDETRPRSGVIRSREFIMKDAYSFHTSYESLDKIYEVMKETYKRIFTRCGLKFYVIEADPGAMGGGGSQEFVLFSKAGEDRVVRLGDTDRVMSGEMASRKLKGAIAPPIASEALPKYVEKHTPGVSSVEALATFFKAKPKDMVKTMIYSVESNGASACVAVLVRGDHEVSEFKLKKKHRGVRLATREEIESCGSSFGFSGPLNLKVSRIYIDEDVTFMNKMIIGANRADYHFAGVTYPDILKAAQDKLEIGDFRQAVEGDEADVNGKTVSMQIHTAIELGHIFKLNLRYSEPMKAFFLDETGKANPMIMGCYGIGVNRILASAIEQSSTEKGIRWPSLAISPYSVLLLSTHMQDEQTRSLSAKIYQELTQAGVDVLWDDRDVSAGIKFNDADLIGIPIRVTIGPRGLKNSQIEIKDILAEKVYEINIEQALAHLLELMEKE